MQKKIRAVIIDDEPEAIRQLAFELNRTGNIEIAGTFTNPLSVKQMLQDTAPDILFLDVQMPQKNGIEVLKEIGSSISGFSVVMVTAYNDYMLDAFRNEAFDFLLKPVNSDEIQNLITRYYEKRLEHVNREKVDSLVTHLKRKIRIPSITETWFFSPEEILYFSADGKYTHIFQADGTCITTSVNLGALEELLPQGDFCRISRSSVVNLGYLKRIDRKKKCCVLSAGNDEIELPLSKIYTCHLDHLM
jgi:two-component system LytT family response regulator